MTNTDPGAPQYEYDWQNPNKKSFDFGRVLGRAFSGVLANIKPLLIAIGITLIFSVSMSLFSTSQLKNIIGDGDIESAILSPGYWLWSLGPGVPALLFTIWIQLIVIETSYAEFTNGAQPVSPLTSTLRFLLPMLVIAIIYFIICNLGFYALLIGFLFVWPGWALAGPILVLEKKGIFGSLGQAWSLSKGSKRWILLLLFLLSLLTLIIYTVMTAITMAVIGGNVLFGGDPTATLYMPIEKQIFLNLSMGLIGYFIYAVFASGLTAAYVEVKTIKDGAPSLGEIFS